MTTPFPFVSGAVLTAAQLNAITEVPVSAKTASYTLAATDAGSRITMSSASATTITVNTGLFTAGQSLRIQNLNGGGICTVTAGTATVTSAGPLALVAWAGGQLFFSSASAAVWFPDAVTATVSGLTLVKTQTIGNAVGSVTVSDAFSATYDNYKISISGGVASATSILKTTLGASAASYSGSTIYYSATGSSTSPGTPGGLSSTTDGYYWSGSGTTNSLIYNVEVQNPFLAKYTFFQGSWYDISQGAFSFGAHSVATSYTAFTLTPNTGTLTGGTIRVYGYANS
jgi:hypothetical protein